MPNWKKVIVSGSDATFKSVTVPSPAINQLTASVAITALNTYNSTALNSGTVQQFGTPTASWYVEHNLNEFWPIVYVWQEDPDYTYTPIITDDIQIINQNALVVNFPTATRGYVNVSRAGHVVSGSVPWTNLTGPANVTASLNVYGGFTGSLQGTASWAINTRTASLAVSSSFAQTASYLNDLSQSVIITGSVTGTSFTGSLLGPLAVPLSSGAQGRLAANGTAMTIGHSATGTHITINATNTTAFSQVANFNNGATVQPGGNSTGQALGVTVGNYPAANLATFSSGSVVALRISGSGLMGTGSFNYSGNIIATSFTGSLFGTASWASNTTSASYSISSSFAVSASQVNSSSYAATSSHALRSVTASYAETASYAVNFNVSQSLTASGLRYPTVDGIFAGQVMQTDAAGTLSIGNVNAVFETIYNGEATTLTKGTVVYVSGSQGANPIAYRADTSDPTRMPVTFVVAENIAPAATGRGVTLGLITGINMTGYSTGDLLWVNGNGALTPTRPTGSTDIIQPIAIVTKPGSGGQINILNPGPVLLPNLQSGSVWIGDSSNFPVAVATSSIQNVVSSSFATTAITASHALTASSADNFLVRGTLTAQTIVAQVITSSTDFVTGSTRFGSLLSNTHQFTGSASITGSLNVNNSPVVTSASYTPFSSSVSIRVTNLEGTASVLTTASASFAAVSSSYSIASASFASLSASYAAASSSLSTRVTSLESASSSFAQQSGSNSTRLTRLESTASVLTTASASFTTVSASYSIASGSLSTRATNLESTASTLTAASASFALVSSSYSALSGSFRTGSYTGSFTGTGNFTGSLQGTASWAQNATTASFVQGTVSASFASTASSVNPLNQNVVVTGSLTIAPSSNRELQVTSTGVDIGNAVTDVHTVTGSVRLSGSIEIGPTLSNSSAQLLVTGTPTRSKGIIISSSWDYQSSWAMWNGIYSGEFNLGGPTKNVSEGGPGSFQISLYNASTLAFRYPITAYANGNVVLGGSSTVVPADTGEALQVTGAGRITSGLTVTGSLIAPSVTGSLQGTASWAQNVSTASYVLNAVTASFATTASLAATASVATSASYAITASHALNAGSSFSLSGSENGRLIVSDGSSNAATASANLTYLSNTLRITGSISSSGDLLIRGSGTTSTTFGLTVQNSTGTNLFQVRNDNGAIFLWGECRAIGNFQVDQITTRTTGNVAFPTNISLGDGNNLIVGTGTGAKIGTATSQKIGFWNAAPIVQPTTAVAAATFVANSGTAVNSASTFDGYTMAQVVKALRNAGILA